MKTSKQNLKIRRMRPFMGTLVEIEVRGENSDVCLECIEKGFVEIAKVENLMSQFRKDSEVSRFNNLKVGESIEASSEVITVLRLSEELRELSEGVFDISLGAGKVFSICGQTLTRDALGSIDLGGVAKGYAVDQAGRVMAPGVSGIVNAGGDLKAFGDESREIFLQDVNKGNPKFYPVKLNNLAVATSNLREKDGAQFKLLPAREQKTVSIFAESCMIADALTKIALRSTKATRQILDRCLDKYDAKAFLA
jgi:thiamine biosynthesis lipoprotein